MSTQPMEAGDLELSLLRTFLAVVGCGSLGKTAAAIDKTQPAISQQMLRLERIVGHKLFARGRNGITLTHHGELLMAYASRVVDLNDEILVRLRGERPGGRVTIGMKNGLAMAGLGTAMERFQGFHPDVELRVVVTAGPELDTLLTTGEIHLAIGEPLLMRRSPSTRWRMPLQWAAQKDLKVERHQTLPLVLFEGPCSWQDDMLDSLRRAGREWRVRFESTSLDAILAATQSGLGIAALPAEAVRSSNLARVGSAHLPPPPNIEFGLFHAAALPQAAQTLVELLEIALASTFQLDPESGNRESQDFAHSAA